MRLIESAAGSVEDTAMGGSCAGGKRGDGGEMPREWRERPTPGVVFQEAPLEESSATKGERLREAGGWVKAVTARASNTLRGRLDIIASWVVSLFSSSPFLFFFSLCPLPLSLRTDPASPPSARTHYLIRTGAACHRLLSYSASPNPHYKYARSLSSFPPFSPSLPCPTHHLLSYIHCHL